PVRPAARTAWGAAAAGQPAVRLPLLQLQEQRPLPGAGDLGAVLLRARCACCSPTARLARCRLRVRRRGVPGAPDRRGAAAGRGGSMAPGRKLAAQPARVVARSLAPTEPADCGARAVPPCRPGPA